ncbi:hypothetical protein AMAG_06701 [Allomyces macrogynus ATCC 38327]|uniref:Pseudouridine synthase RsuA/RluA-like domain-containing protein n=1 Tax=Allomyces macrogynus (strain ATCC 38327) TaxID=578462 RepID=A0A0L0SES6_ALLM3|nr:hypothetical protein AMAG_06701 [Allomyces macrogynus ATCC 38327]|eukprot:KNE60939.1 hypothetical protein AMAG_06701 [Allomyces macrogynus ATCC 38327]
MLTIAIPQRHLRNDHHPGRPIDRDCHDILSLDSLTNPTSTPVSASKRAKLLISPAMTRVVVPTSLTGASVRCFLTQHHAIPSAKLHALLNNRLIYVVATDVQSAARVTDHGLRLAGGDVMVLDATVDVADLVLDEVAVDDAVVVRVKSWILHDDDRTVVINKPGGVAVQGGSRSVAGMLPAIARAGGGGRGDAAVGASV